MPEFKVVIADPHARNLRIVPVRVVGDEDLEYSDKHREQRELPLAKLHPTIADIIKPELGVIIVRIWKDRKNREKIKLAARVILDSSIDVMEARVPADFMREKVGSLTALGEVFRAPAFQIRVSGEAANRFLGLKIGDRIDASFIGLEGKLLEIRGGSDLAGFPMRPDIPGPVKKYVLLSSGPGFRPREDGERRRKLVRGNTISEDIVQINTVVIY
ncbi:MAG TPA: 30S ribosomal protein S6e [Ignisphaera sp.]|uniref:Small ribosomal subunit protein eS6 n=1 Tax=Ignisphaera aggregans TaxID=334771 RepID=A0A833DUI6_9CREN|nr:30S ribosomal protein S6e [Ignisphaera sp.]HIP56500.1 30S ribosomal protein S6e [Ignisphaera aggregans]